MPRKPTRKRLKKVEKFYIEHNCQGKSLEDLAVDLQIPKTLIEPYYNECLDKIRKAKEKKEKEAMPTAGKLLARKEDRGVVVMTRESSEFADTKQPSRVSKAKESARDKKHIHKFRSE